MFDSTTIYFKQQSFSINTLIEHQGNAKLLFHTVTIIYEVNALINFVGKLPHSDCIKC